MAITNIGIFGKRNTGKSSLINILLGQDFAIVSDKPGTTTDPIKKRMEIFGLGPCQLIDTAGIDDRGELGRKRVSKTREIISQVDIALLLFTANDFGKFEKEIYKELSALDIPTILVHNQSDIVPLDTDLAMKLTAKSKLDLVEFSCCLIEPQAQKEAVEMLLSLIVNASYSCAYHEKEIFSDLVKEGEKVLLVCPQDSEAPTGRLILPQVMAIRDLLDRKAIVSAVVPESLDSVFPKTKTPGRRVKPAFVPDLVVTDSQVFKEVAAMVPENVPLTSFSMLLARSKGCFQQYLIGTPNILELIDGDRILILESCTHPSSCEDIGRVKLPKLFTNFTGKKLEFDIVSGLDSIQRPVTDYAMVVQCGGCMITGRQLHSRLAPAISAGIPVTNYGMAISYMNGIFDRAVAPLLVSKTKGKKTK